MTDHLGSTVKVLSDTGAVVSETKYYPYGAPRVSQPPSSLAFTGQRREGTLGGAFDPYYYGARFYSTELGHFLSPDPLTVDGYNRYQYVRGNPLRYTDPTGLCGEEMVVLWDSCSLQKPAYVAGDVGPVQAGAPCSALCIGLRDLAAANVRGPEDIAYRQALIAINGACQANSASYVCRGLVEPTADDCSSNLGPWCSGLTHDGSTGCRIGDTACRDARTVPGTQCTRWDQACIDNAEKSDVCALPSSQCPLGKFATTRPCSPIFGDACPAGDGDPGVEYDVFKIIQGCFGGPWKCVGNAVARALAVNTAEAPEVPGTPAP